MTIEKIIKYLTGNASPDEARAYDEWKELSPANRDFAAKIEAEWNMENPMRIPSVTKAWKDFERIHLKKKTSGIILLKRLAAAAAIVGIIITCWHLLDQPKEPAAMLVAEATQDTLTIRLNDGSEAVLFPNSSLQYPGEFDHGQRLVKLTGSARFTVTRRENQNFKVNHPNLDIEVLGTIFTVITTPGGADVQVKEGIVKVSAGRDSLILEAGQQANVSNGELTQKEMTASFEFDNKTLTEAIKELETVFNTKILLTDPGMGSCLITASFPDKPLEEILATICDLHSFTQTRRQNAYELSGEGCD